MPPVRLPFSGSKACHLAQSDHTTIILMIKDPLLATEPAAYSLLSYEEEANDYALALMMVHLHVEHKMGVRDIAKRFGVKMIDVKKALAEKLAI